MSDLPIDQPPPSEPDDDPGFPPLRPVRSSTALVALMDDRMRAIGVELPAGELTRVRTSVEARLAAARSPEEEEKALRSGAMMLIAPANSALRQNGHPRRWQPLVAPGEKLAKRAQWFLVDDAERRLLLQKGYRTIGAALGFHPVTLILAALTWALAFVAYRERTALAVGAVVAAYVAWFVARRIVKRRADRG